MLNQHFVVNAKQPAVKEMNGWSSIYWYYLATLASNLFPHNIFFITETENNKQTQTKSSQIWMQRRKPGKEM